MSTFKSLINAKNYTAIRTALAQQPALANEGIGLDEDDSIKAHPLHRICDGVFNNSYTDEEACEMAKLFLAFGANVNGYALKEKKDTPLIAAASLHAEKTAILYIDHKADIYHAGCSGGTALHWAAWVGRERLVKRLIQENAIINQRCIDFKGTPLLWAVHGYKFGGEKNRHHQIECVRLLVEAGADKCIPNVEGMTAFEFLDESDTALIDVLKE